MGQDEDIFPVFPTPLNLQNRSNVDDDQESYEDFKRRLIYWVGQMMFVSGETAEPSPETTWMIEEIVREQVLEMVWIPCYRRVNLANHELTEIHSSNKRQSWPTAEAPGQSRLST